MPPIPYLTRSVPAAEEEVGVPEAEGAEVGVEVQAAVEQVEVERAVARAVEAEEAQEALGGPAGPADQEEGKAGLAGQEVVVAAAAVEGEVRAELAGRAPAT